MRSVCVPKATHNASFVFSIFIPLLLFPQQPHTMVMSCFLLPVEGSRRSDKRKRDGLKTDSVRLRMTFTAGISMGIISYVVFPERIGIGYIQVELALVATRLFAGSF